VRLSGFGVPKTPRNPRPLFIDPFAIVTYWKSFEDHEKSHADEVFNLKAAVEREKAVQAIDVHRECTNCVVTFWVMSQFLHFLGASRGCADFRDPTAVFRIMQQRREGAWIRTRGNVTDPPVAMNHSVGTWEA